MSEGAADIPCRICGSATVPAGSRRGILSEDEFELARCPQCGFGFVVNPRTDYEAIYDDAYYHGKGADPLVDYMYEFEHPELTVRRYEWRGIVRAVSELVRLGPETRWLDYGCGTGGLVTHLREQGIVDAVGFEEGWAESRLRERGVPLLTREELDEHAESFDVVTAIEVIEHIVDPLPALQAMADLLRPGGLLFLTTGNASGHADHLSHWSYVRPEIHVSFFEPRTLAEALRRVGLEPAFPGFLPGWDQIIKFKILKNLRRRRAFAIDGFLDWRLVTRLAHLREPVTAHPVGRKPDRSEPAPQGFG